MVRLTSLSLSPVQTDPLLDQVEGRKPGSKAGAKVKTPPKRPEHNLDQAIEWFAREYPGHFADERFVKGEVALKRAAQQLFGDKLGNGAGERLLAEGNFAEIGTLLDAVYRTTKIPGALRDGGHPRGARRNPPRPRICSRGFRRCWRGPPVAGDLRAARRRRSGAAPRTAKARTSRRGPP